jgi:hypothetical protein
MRDLDNGSVVYYYILHRGENPDARRFFPRMRGFAKHEEA